MCIYISYTYSKSVKRLLGFKYEQNICHEDLNIQQWNKDEYESHCDLKFVKLIKLGCTLVEGNKRCSRCGTTLVG